MWYKNLYRSFFRFVAIHAFDRGERQTDRRTADRILNFSSLDRVCIPCSAVKNVIKNLLTYMYHMKMNSLTTTISDTNFVRLLSDKTAVKTQKCEALTTSVKCWKSCFVKKNPEVNKFLLICNNSLCSHKEQFLVSADNKVCKHFCMLEQNWPRWSLTKSSISNHG